jgi:hypothetical protein
MDTFDLNSFLNPGGQAAERDNGLDISFDDILDEAFGEMENRELDKKLKLLSDFRTLLESCENELEALA